MSYKPPTITKPSPRPAINAQILPPGLVSVAELEVVTKGVAAVAEREAEENAAEAEERADEADDSTELRDEKIELKALSLVKLCK